MAWRDGCATSPTAGSKQSSKDGPTTFRHLVDWAHHGPRLAEVETVAVQPEPPEGLGAFQVR